MNEDQEKKPKPKDEYCYPPGQKVEIEQDKTYGKIISHALAKAKERWLAEYYDEQDKIYPYQEQVYHKKYQDAKRGLFSKKENEAIIKAHEKQEKELAVFYEAIENCRNTFKNLIPAKGEGKEAHATCLKMETQSMQDFINDWKDK